MFENLKEILESIDGFDKKVAYRAFEEGKAPKLPYICYIETGSDNFFADNIVYSSLRIVDIELYSKYRDLKSEKKIEEKLTKYGIAWTRNTEYIEKEKCYETIYTVEV